MKVYTNRTHTVLSSIFFALFCWIMISILGSAYTETFSYIFFIFVRDGNVFDVIKTTILLCGAGLSLFFVIFCAIKKKTNIFLSLFMFVCCVGFISIAFYTQDTQEQDINALLSIESSIEQRDAWEILLGYKVRILLSVFIYVFFIFLPLIFTLFGLRADSQSAVGRILSFISPSLCIVVMALFACSFQPYYYRENIFDYLDLFALLCGVALFVAVFMRNRHKLDFFGYANVAVFVAGMVCVLLCSVVLASSLDYFVVRYMMYAFVFVSWIVEWGSAYILRGGGGSLNENFP
ncbi:hypothetical protein [Helicobacter sp. 23-1046]